MLEGAMTLSAQTLTLIALVALGLSVLSLVFSASGVSRRRREPGGPIHLDDVLRGIL